MPTTSAKPAIVQLASLRPFLAELERFHAWANKALFGRALSREVIITLASRGRRKARGWFAQSRWAPTNVSGRPGTHEILIAAEHANLPPAEVLDTLLHEMVHQWNHERGVRDTDKTGRRHNLRFKRAAEAHGLIAERDRQVGWGRTHLQPATLERIHREFRPDVTKFNAYRPDLGAIEKAPTRLKLWVCACDPVFRVRVARSDFDATCNRCRTPFRRG